MDKFDWFIKKQLRIKYYFRYVDDFVVVDSSPEDLECLIEPIGDFLNVKLGLKLHPQKVEIRKFRQGIDFLGYVILPHYITLRTKTKKRMFKKVKLNKEKLNQGLVTKESFYQSLQPYRGVLKHCNSHKLEKGLNVLVKSCPLFKNQL